MSAQMVEILILAVIAFFIISKLLSVLGTTDEDDPMKKKAGSFFGEPKGLKDVTGTVVEPVSTAGSKVIPLRANVVFSDDTKVNDIIRQIVEKMPDFNHEKFLKGSKGAFKMVLEALMKHDEKTLTTLVDKRFLTELEGKVEHYKKASISDVTAAFEDAYSFGNSIYIKVMMSGKKFKEFWVFTRNLNQAGPDWHLSNIEV